MAHWLAATVHVARNSLAEAERALDAGLAGDAEPVASRFLGPPKPRGDGGSRTSSARFSAVALHWLRGLIHLARGDETAALDEFERELAAETGGHLYARECCANTYYAIGALWLHRGRIDEARAAFERALERVAIHPMARVGLAAIGKAAGHGGEPPAQASPGPRGSSIDRAMCEAAGLLLDAPANIGEAVAHIGSALAEASPAISDGWLIPVDPLLRVHAAPDAWTHVLARLRSRAF